MAEKDYPVHMYKHLHQPRYAHDRKVLEAMTLDGWTDVRANVPKQEFPKGMFNPENGDCVTVGDYGKDGVVDLEKAERDELRLTNQGWTTKAVAKIPEKTVAVPRGPTGQMSGASRIDLLEQQVAEIQETQSEILDLLRASVAAKQPATPKRGKSADPDGLV